MDEERHRISLGMKSLDNENDMDILSFKEESSEAIGDDSGSQPHESSSLAVEGMDIESENEECAVLAQAESRAFIPPLDVTLDDLENSDMDGAIDQNQKDVDETKIIDKKEKRQAKKKANEERSFENYLFFSHDVFAKFHILNKNIFFSFLRLQYYI